MSSLSERISFIWAFADLLSGPYELAQYGKVRSLEQVYRVQLRSYPSHQHLRGQRRLRRVGPLPGR